MTIIRDPRSWRDFFGVNSEYCCMPHYRLVSLDMIGTDIEYFYLHFLHKTLCSFWMISIIDCVITRVNNIYFQPVSFLSVCNGETKRKLQKAIYFSNCWEMEHRCFFSCTRLFVCFESKSFYSFILSRSAKNSFHISAFDSQMLCLICCHKCDRSSNQITLITTIYDSTK